MPKLVQIIFKTSARISNRTSHFTITKINWLMLFKEIIAIYSDKHTTPEIQNAYLLIVKAGGTCSYN
jgi:hypothetical protein